MLLHWLIAVVVLAQLGSGFFLGDLAPPGTPARATALGAHASFGVLIGALAIAAVLRRWRHRPPPWPAAMHPWQGTVAELGHEAMYICMIAAPLCGYVAANFGAQPITLFGAHLAPWGPDVTALYRVFSFLHDMASWALCVLIAVHIAAALKHGLVDRDGVFWRMIPPLH